MYVKHWQSSDRLPKTITCKVVRSRTEQKSEIHTHPPHSLQSRWLWLWWKQNNMIRHTTSHLPEYEWTTTALKWQRLFQREAQLLLWWLWLTFQKVFQQTGARSGAALSPCHEQFCWDDFLSRHTITLSVGFQLWRTKLKKVCLVMFSELDFQNLEKRNKLGFLYEVQNENDATDCLWVLCLEQPVFDSGTETRRTSANAYLLLWLWKERSKLIVDMTTEEAWRHATEFCRYSPSASHQWEVELTQSHWSLDFQLKREVGRCSHACLVFDAGTKHSDAFAKENQKNPLGECRKWSIVGEG